MKKYKTISVKNRNEWRRWLSKNFDKHDEIWLIFPKKSSGIQSMVYNEAVEEALCFGWIDSTVKTLDENNTIQRFSPRNPHSAYSQANKERLKWLNDNNMLHPLVKEAVKNVLNEEFVFPVDIMNAIKRDKSAWENFNKFSLSYKRI